MIKVDENQIEVNGITPLLATELAMMLLALNDLDKQIIPLAFTAVCTDGGDSSLSDALAKYKEQSDLILEKISEAYKLKGEKPWKKR